MHTDARTVLSEVFGYENFRSGQQDIIQAVSIGRDVLGVLPTGGGKSLCFQIPALMRPGVTLVVSPLIALMKDQTQRLRERGVKAASLHGSMSTGEMNNTMHEASVGRLSLLYVAPERLESTSFRRQLQSLKIGLLAVDEAHCISEWGHDYRPSYLAIPQLFDFIPRVPIIALTATATPDVRADVIRALQMHKAVEVVRGFDRPNLSLRVENTPWKAEFITRTSRRDEGSMLVYAGSRRRVDTIADELRRRGVNAGSYHAGKSDTDRSDAQDKFLEGTIPVLVATSAFGMGIDKADIRNVVHADLTLTLEAYYQEAGRAGRDGNPSSCTMLYQQADRRLMEFFITSTYPEKSAIDSVYDYVFDRAGVGIGGTLTEPVLADAASIGTSLHTPVAVVNGALSILERAGILLRTSPTGHSRIRLRTSRERLDEFANATRGVHHGVVDAVVRLVAGRDMNTDLEFSVYEFVRRHGFTIPEFGKAMHALQMARLLRYTPPSVGGGIVLNGARTTREGIPVDMEGLHRRREHAVRKLEVVVRYAETTQCKRTFILHYFGDPEVKGDCGRCSSCLSTKSRPEFSERQLVIAHAALRAAYEVQGRFGRNVVADIVTGNVSPKVTSYALDRSTVWNSLAERTRFEVLEVIDECLQRGWLVQSSSLYPTIGVSVDGVKQIRPLPSPLTLETPTKKNLKPAPAMMRLLSALRLDLANREGVAASSLVGLSELERIASDAPMTAEELVPGRHGSALFLSRHGSEVVALLREIAQPTVRSVPKFVVDEEVVRTVESIRSGWTLRNVASTRKITPAMAAHHIETALKAGMTVNRDTLVPDELYADVVEFMRTHRFAKLRHVREHLTQDVEMVVLRLALAFARRELFNEGVE
ncbi:MAG: RecQ family ATP-dependent DNA helicase [bacterium]|nr:RecQ family ATP-dependent DNA helicase [bacterium]